MLQKTKKVFLGMNPNNTIPVDSWNHNETLQFKHASMGLNITWHGSGANLVWIVFEKIAQ